ncbi:hypothetical protein [Capnocytophaga canimorsus]|uniref:hypothetical protein n=1 Tax=Capnocytophaga canimorsus TaxID=28188 RepID=UPI001EE0A1FD|nr:hypothetical protein [Capnocytophaga canimorsus]
MSFAGVRGKVRNMSATLMSPTSKNHGVLTVVLCFCDTFVLDDEILKKCTFHFEFWYIWFCGLYLKSFPIDSGGVWDFRIVQYHKRKSDTVGKTVPLVL